MRREERVTVQGPVKEQQPDGMSHGGGGGRSVRWSLFGRTALWGGRGGRCYFLHICQTRLFMLRRTMTLYDACCDASYYDAVRRLLRRVVL